MGPEGTPYENGVFLFDIWLPPSYPEVPPKVQFLTTGGGRVRLVAPAVGGMKAAHALHKDGYKSGSYC